MRAVAIFERLLVTVFLASSALLTAPANVVASGHGPAKSHDSHDAHGSHGSGEPESAKPNHGPPKEVKTEADVDAAAAATGAKIRGIELGFFKVRTDHPVKAQKSMVRFVLQTSVPSERYAEMKDLIERNLHRLRDQIITTTRLAPLSVFEEPELTTFRRLILVRLRRTLPELAIDDLFVSDFQLSVKSL